MITELLSLFDWSITASGMSRLPPLAQCLATIAMGAVAILFFRWAAVLVESPLARHACGLCNLEACQLCIDEARNQRVNKYVTQARERRRAS